MGERPEQVLARRDAAFVHRLLPMATSATWWFRPEVRGLERLPDTGPYLMVGPHSGGIFMPDVMALVSTWLRSNGPETELFCLGYDLLLSVPVVGRMLERFGVVRASPANAEAALRRGAAVLVYPGGDVEDCRPWRDRHRVDLAGHTGFVRLALRTGVPVVPVVAHGSHEADVIVSRGDRLAKLLGLSRLRIKVFPLVLGVPFGLVPIFIPHLPLPARVTVEVLDPLDWRAMGPEAADDADVVTACYRDVVDRLQTALDRLAAVPALPLLDPPSHVDHVEGRAAA